MSKFFTRALGALLLALSVGAVQAQAPAARAPIEAFFENSPYSAAVLSPSARYLALRMSASGKRESLAVVNLETGAVAAVAGFNDVDVGNFHWINDQRLVFDTTNKQRDRSISRAPGLFGVDRDGRNFQQLVMREGDDWGVVQGNNSNIKREMLQYNNYMLGQKGADDSDFVYVTSPSSDGTDLRFQNLRRVHAVSARSTNVPRPPNTVSWLLDYKGEPRIAVALDKEIKTIHYRDPVTSEWRVLVSFNRFSAGPEAFEPLAFGPDGTLYVSTHAGKDKLAVHTFDFKTGTIAPEAKINTDDYDFDGTLIFGKDKLLGMRLTTDAESTMWFDPTMKAVQAAVDALLPATANLISVGERAEAPFVLVESFSDVTPRQFMVYNTETKAFRKVGSTQPNINPAQMGLQQAVRYKARDGLVIPAWLTLPAKSSGKNLPMVVLVHGGPNVRGGQWGWDADAQFLASRGYAVLEPEYRGSTGFGDAHFRAGWKQWGRAMQNDVADGAKWAIGQGIVDPKRICIAGASYGGYSALMGLANDPDLFKCGINWVGVTDINLLFTGKWNFIDDLSDYSRKYSMPELIGDPVKDAEQFKATSPLLLAAKIKQPLLLAYGDLDRRVPAFHGEQFYKAVKAHNPNVEWVVYADEGHGWMLPKTRVDFWTRVEKFLDKNIGQP
ncbi:MAG: S9 family peptidase [Pseudomonadota bacterium]